MDVYVSEMDIIGTNIPALRIGILVIDGFAVMSYASLVEPMRAANLLGRRPLYEMVNIGLKEAPISSSGATVVMPQAQVGDDLKLDYLFVVAGGDPTTFDDKHTFAWLSRQARLGVQLGGVSGGPIILAQAGLMRGRRMTVHWEHAAALAEISPHLLIERTLFVIDRDRVTCAGGTAPMDLMHALITRHHGAPFARLVSDWFMHTEIRPSVGPQRAGLVARVGTTNVAILEAVRAMEANVAEPLTLDQIAQIAGVSPRQLNRVFKQKLGRSTMRYYRDMRLDLAQNLLGNSPLSLTEIALATGFASSSHFARVYAEAFGVPPSSNRTARALQA
ncbi:MAG: GlxA family transcriptional regulator [Roseovarius sp.]